MIKENLTHIHQEIQRVAYASDRNPAEIKLIAVSKNQNISSIEEAFNVGQRCFGENYIQEALEKMNALKHLDIEWHFIGTLQSNKTKWIAEHFNWFQSLSHEKLAVRLNEQRPLSMPPLNVLIQVNLDQEPSKQGLIHLEDILTLIKVIKRLPKLKLRGLMAIPAPKDTLENQQITFRLFKNLFDHIKACGYDLDILSMGMSNDYTLAIQEGSNCIRIGTAIFGERKKF